MIEGCRQRGIEPVVTLHHFTEPRWLSKEGGWTAPDATDRFVGYVEALVPILESVRWIVTINEPNIAAIQARTTTARPCAERAAEAERDVPGAPLPAPHRATTERLIAAHHAAREVLHERLPGRGVGWSVANQVIQSVPGGEDAAARTRSWSKTRSCVSPETTRSSVCRATRARSSVPTASCATIPRTRAHSPAGSIRPDALEHAVRHTREVVGDVPILVTENGIATGDDEVRIAYTTHALAGTRARDRRRHRRAGLPPLEPARQLRMGLLHTDLRTRRLGPRDLRPDSQALGPLARKRGPRATRAGPVPSAPVASRAPRRVPGGPRRRASRRRVRAGCRPSES